MSWIVKNESKIRRPIELDPAPFRQHALHLFLEVVPLRRAVEILEHGEATLQQISAERARLDLGHRPEAGLPHEGDRILEQIRIVEREDATAVDVDVEIGELVQDLREMLFGARIVVIPRRVPAAAEAAAATPCQADERDPPVILHIGRDTARNARPIELRRHGRRREQHQRDRAHPARHGGIIRQEGRVGRWGR